MVHYAAAALFGLAASVTAGSLKHAHHAHLHKKGGEYAAPSSTESVDVCLVYTSTWYGEPSLVPYTVSSTSTPCPSSTYEAPAETSTPPPPPPTTYAAPTYAAPTTSTPPPAPAQPSGYNKQSSAGGIATNGNQWAMTYTPYAEDGTCKDAGTIMNDIGTIKGKGFTTVRLYATDCNAPQYIGAACRSHSMKMLLGIYIDGSGLSGAYSQLSTLTAWGGSNWDMVDMVIVGNEAIFNGFVTASALAGFIGECKSKLKAAGYSGPVTTTEPLDIIQANAATICDCVDVIGANIHAYFNSAVTASQAGSFVASQLQLLSDACGGSKEAYNLETGWPSSGLPNGAAIAGAYQQKQAIESIVAAVGSKSAIFSYENDNWKAPGSLGVEQYFGCSDLFSG